MILKKISRYVMEDCGYTNKEGLPENKKLKNVPSLARLFSKKPTLNMFVPCSEEGKPMPHPTEAKGLYNDSSRGQIEFDNYKKIDYPSALNQVIFEGEFTVRDCQDSYHIKELEIYVTKRSGKFIWLYGGSFETVEDIVNSNYDWMQLKLNNRALIKYDIR